MIGIPCRVRVQPRPGCRLSMRPQFMTRGMGVLRAKLGIAAGDFDATVLALR
jgi:hypothetical protein